MYETLISLLPVWGYVLIVVFNALGRCGIPLPSSVLMISYGALVVQDAAHLVVAIAVAYGSALAGDVAGYWIGLKGSGFVDRLAARSAKAQGLLRQAQGLEQRWGAVAVLITRWPLSTVGPYVNLVAGAVRQPFARFIGYCGVGELIWVSLYLTMGHVFAANLDAVLAQTGRVSLAVGAAALVGVFVWMRLRPRRSALR